MRKYIFFFLFIIGFCHYSYAQKEGYNWHFGRGAAINFETSPPSVITTSKIYASEGCASISDGDGNLLFYTNGETVWNKSNDTMLNGAELFGGQSSCQSSVIVKVINQDGLYYVFTTDQIDDLVNVAPYDGVCYSIIDMKADNGLGKVISKNNKITGEATEKMVVVPHANGTDFWLVVDKPNINQYESYLVTASGVNLNPVVSNVGYLTLNIGFGVGFMKASHDYKHIAVSYVLGGLELFDFDNATGLMSNAQKILVSPSRVNGVEFSPNSNFLYASDGYQDGKIYQFNISSGNAVTIKASKYTVTSGNILVSQLQLAPDGNIYCIIGGQAELSIIDEPNRAGAACNFVKKGLAVWPGHPYLGLPQFYSPYIFSDRINHSNLCLGDTTEFKIFNKNLVDSVTWAFGDTASITAYRYTSDTLAKHVYQSSGKYTVKAIRWKNGVATTETKEIEIFNYPEFSLGGDTSVCEGDSVLFDFSDLSPAQYNWSSGQTGAFDTITKNGVYSLSVNSNGCITQDSIVVNYDSNYKFYLPHDTLICDRDTLWLNIGAGADSYLWSNGDTTEKTYLTQQDTFTVTTVNGACRKIDSIFLELKPLPLFELVSDTVICNTDSITLGGTGNVKHEWSNGDTNQTITVKQTGLYILKQTNKYCYYTDTLNLSVQQQPSLFIGTDTVVCAGAKVIMGNTIPNGITYTWNNRGVGTPKITTDTQAIYSAIAYDGVCKAYDTMYVGVYNPQGVNLGGDDTTVCAGYPFSLDASVKLGKYLWSNGKTDAEISITEAGLYKVTVTDSVCEYSDSITVYFNPVPPLDLGSDTALCQDEVHQVTVNSGWDRVNWDDGRDDFTRIFINEGSYKLTASYLNCSKRDSVNVRYHPPLPEIDLGDDKDVCDPLFVPIEAKGAGYYGYIWQDGTRGNYYEVTQTGDYIVSTLPHRCGQVSDTIHVNFLREDCDIHVPNAFTPNGDGDNDYFYPIGHEIEMERMEIYNRWGELIYNKAEPWDGTYGGKVLPNGSYVYVIHYKKEYRGSKKWMMVKGTVMIVR